MIEDTESNTIKGIGRMRNGLYYLINEPLESIVRQIRNQSIDLSGKKVMNASS